MEVGFEFRGIRRHRRRPLRKRGSEPSRGTYGPVPLKPKVATEREGQPFFLLSLRHASPPPPSSYPPPPLPPLLGFISSSPGHRLASATVRTRVRIRACATAIIIFK